MAKKVKITEGMMNAATSSKPIKVKVTAENKERRQKVKSSEKLFKTNTAKGEKANQ